MAKNTAGKDSAAQAIEGSEELLRFFATRDAELWDRITQRDAYLQEKVLDIVSQIVDSSAVDSTLGSGLHEIAEQIQIQMSPLREIPNSHQKLDKKDDARLVSLQLALERPDFSLPLTTDVGPLLGVPATGQDKGRSAS